MRALAAALALLAGAACRPATPPASATEPAAAGGPAAGSPAAGGEDGAAVPLVTVRDVLDRPDLVDREVRVTGRCLALGVARASGPPPRTRSDWQLAAGEVAVWVTGTRPPDCPTDTGSTHDDTIVARVAQDTVRVMPSDAGRVRRYLVRRGREGARESGR